MSYNSASKAHLDRQSGLSSFLPGTRKMGQGEMQPPGQEYSLLGEGMAVPRKNRTAPGLNRVLRMKCGLGDKQESTESGKRVWFLNQKDSELESKFD